MSDFEIREGLPPVAAYQAIRAETGWPPFADRIVWKALAGSQFGAVAVAETDIVGFGRVTGDGATVFYIEDLIVAKNHRGKGVGAAILDALIRKIERVAPTGAMIALLAAEGTDEFYEANGFTRRPGPGYGPAMMRAVGGSVARKTG